MPSALDRRRARRDALAAGGASDPLVSTTAGTNIGGSKADRLAKRRHANNCCDVKP